MRRIVGSRWVRIAFGLIAVGLLCAALANQWPSVAPKFRQLSALGLITSSIAVLVGMFASLKTWQVALGGLGSRLPLAAAGRIFFIGQIGKYVPGSVWPVIVQMELGADAGVPRASSAMTLLFIYLLYTTSAALVTASCLPWVTDAFPVWLAVLALVVGLTLLVPAVLNRLLGIGLRLLRQKFTVRMPAGAILESFAWALVMWACFGVHVYLLCTDLGHAGDGRLLVLAVGGYTIAWITGFLAIVAPAGGGVRELVLTAILAPTIGHADAFAVALVSRLLMTVGDLVCAAGAAASLGPGRLRALRTRQSARADDRESYPA